MGIAILGTLDGASRRVSPPVRLRPASLYTRRCVKSMLPAFSVKVNPRWRGQWAAWVQACALLGWPAVAGWCRWEAGRWRQGQAKGQAGQAVEGAGRDAPLEDSRMSHPDYKLRAPLRPAAVGGYQQQRCSARVRIPMMVPLLFYYWRSIDSHTLSGISVTDDKFQG